MWTPEEEFVPEVTSLGELAVSGSYAIALGKDVRIALHELFLIDLFEFLSFQLTPGHPLESMALCPKACEVVEET